MTTWRVKYGIRVDRLQPEILLALDKLERIFPYGVISSTDEQVGVRKTTSKHWSGNAVDFLRVTCSGEEFNLKDIKECVGPGYDVLEYSWGYHLEWDPR